jgi:hypothetical protein
MAEENGAKLTETGIIDGAPTGFVKGGTSTSKNDEVAARLWHDAERRRDIAAAEQELACVPIEQGGAKLFTNKLTPNAAVPKAYVLLRYVNRYGQPMAPWECCADVLIEDFARPNDLTLQIVCPRCIVRGRHGDQCQIALRPQNKRWYLRPGAGPQTFLFDDGFGTKTYKSAGVVLESERFQCADCTYEAVIANNEIREL